MRSERGGDRPPVAKHRECRSVRLLAGTVTAVFLLIAVVACRDDGRAIPPDKSRFPGTKSAWRGFKSHTFDMDAGTIQVVMPRAAALGKPWVWHSEHLELEAAANVSLLERGYHVVRLNLANGFGSPEAVHAWDVSYKLMTGTHGLAKKPALVGVSRGALSCYNWAAQNPDKVSCIVGDAAVCDLKSWPGCRGRADPSPADLAALMEIYGVAAEDELYARALNPIDSLGPLADHRVPLLHVYGDMDTKVPWEENAGAVADRYRKLGGTCELIGKPGVGHVSGLDDPAPIVEFVERWSRTNSDGRDGEPVPMDSRP